MSAVEILLTATFWAAVLRIATPLIFGTIGELVCERAGVLNLGIEGIMTFGAMIGWLTVYEGGPCGKACWSRALLERSLVCYMAPLPSRLACHNT